MKRLAAIVTAPLLAGACWLVIGEENTAARGQSPPSQPTHALPTGKSPNCTASGCHAGEVGARFLHAPTAAGACDMCHQYLDESKHTFTLKHQGAALCDFCHIGKTDGAGLHMHKPVQDGQCIACHNPHGSEIRNLLRGENTASTCLTCHEAVLKDRPHVHSPMTGPQADCLGCHKAHSSVLPRLLVAQGRDLCLRCHADVERHPAMAGVPQHSGVAPVIAATSDVAATSASSPALVMHEPFTGDCLQCHDQHAATEPNLLKHNSTALCISCHNDIAQKTAQSTVPHSAATSDRACLNCHLPHVSAEMHLLREGQLTLCMDCHNTPIARPDGTKIESVATMMAAGQHLHGALDNGQCGQCHDVHGGSHRALLVRPYTTSFYQAFDDQAYALCFGCHKRELATERLTTTATNFRNGDVNLHYVHVTEPGDKGRSCRVCHATHSAANPQQVRDSAPYGQWNMPLAFTQADNGGSCGAGCHRARTYNRVTAFVNDAAR
jgi:predicted CXXCH cytochrome family protein